MDRRQPSVRSALRSNPNPVLSFSESFVAQYASLDWLVELVYEHSSRWFLSRTQFIIELSPGWWPGLRKEAKQLVQHVAMSLVQALGIERDEFIAQAIQVLPPFQAGN